MLLTLNDIKFRVMSSDELFNKLTSTDDIDEFRSLIKSSNKFNEKAHTLSYHHFKMHPLAVEHFIKQNVPSFNEREDYLIL
jgi:hypothetical protein